MIDSTIITALEDFGVPVQPNGYAGTDLEYISYTYSELGAVFADSKPHAIRYLVDLSWYLPHGKDPSVGKDSIRHLLKDAGATWPSIINANDGEGQHYVFEFEMCGGVPAMPVPDPEPETEPEDEGDNDG